MRDSAAVAFAGPTGARDTAAVAFAGSTGARGAAAVVSVVFSGVEGAVAAASSTTSLVTSLKETFFGLTSSAERQGDLSGDGGDGDDEEDDDEEDDDEEDDDDASGGGDAVVASATTLVSADSFLSPLTVVKLAMSKNNRPESLSRLVPFSSVASVALWRAVRKADGVSGSYSRCCL